MPNRKHHTGSITANVAMNALRATRITPTISHLMLILGGASVSPLFFLPNPCISRYFSRESA